MNALHTLNGRGLNIPALVCDLLGEPNRRASRGNQWRYGSKGSLAVDVTRGLFTNFETGEGGGLLDLVRRVRGGSRVDAAQWLEGDGWDQVSTKRAERLPRPINKPQETETARFNAAIEVVERCEARDAEWIKAIERRRGLFR